MEKAIITVVGHDAVGIIAKVCVCLADENINILDISQTIVSGYFNMMMVVDLAGAGTEFGKLCEKLEKLGESMGLVIKCQKEEIFNMMHRV